MTTQPVLLSDYHPPAFLIDTVDLAFDLDPAATKVVSRMHRCVETTRGRAIDEPSRLHGEALTLVSVQRDGAPLTGYHVENGFLTIPTMPDRCTLQIETRIAPVENTELSGLYVSGGGYFTQCEAEGFRRITYFPDRPDVMARYTVTITADREKVPVMLSNGNPGKIRDLGDGRHQVTWTDPHPKPCYLFALVAGDLVSIKDKFTTQSGRAVDLDIYVRRGDEDKCDHAMHSLKTSMRWDEDVFGLEYDLDVFNIAAVSDFNMGAMENKGLNVFNTKYVLAKPDTATDTDYLGIESVIAHEYFHNWTGDRVTCRDWFQLSLKEGLTVYRDQEFSADQASRAVKRIGDVRALRAAQFREDGGPLAHPVQPKSYLAIDNFYTATVYNKGAEVIRADGHHHRPRFIPKRHGPVFPAPRQQRRDDRGFRRRDGRRVRRQPGPLPQLVRSGRYARDHHRRRLRPHPETIPPDHPPIHQPDPWSAGQKTTGDPGGDGAARREWPGTRNETQRRDDRTRPGARVLLADQAESTFTFENVASPPVPSLFRGFSAPIKLSGISPERSRFLAEHDTDPFVRWDSGQQYATRVLLDMVPAWHRGEPLTVDPSLIEAMSETLAIADKDPAFTAEALSLPGEAFLADQMPIADVDAIHAVRDAARGAIGAALYDRLRAAYDSLVETGPYSIDGAAIGKRALRNICLAYLSAGGDPALAKRQFDTANAATWTVARWPRLRCWRGSTVRNGFRHWPRSTRNGAATPWYWTSGSRSRRSPRCRRLSPMSEPCPRTRIST